MVAALALLALPAASLAGTLTASPSNSTFNTQPYFFGGQFNNFQITNSGTDTTFGSAVITGPDAAQFSVSGDGCNGGTFQDNWTCYVGVSFNPPIGPGAYSAQLEIPSNGSPNPLVIPLDVEVLNGPEFSASPQRIDFEPTLLGAARSQSLTITNSGDFPGAIQQAFVVGPVEFEIEDDQCSQQEIDPGQSCTVTALFRPTAVREYQGSIFAINGTPTTPVLPINLSGEGRAAPGPAPVTKIIGRPKGKTRSRMASFQFTSPDPSVTFECKLDSGPFAPCTSPSTYVVKRGKHTFQVRSTDKSGNLDASPARYRWTVSKKRRSRR
jgi:hypothetical protein